MRSSKSRPSALPFLALAASAAVAGCTGEIAGEHGTDRAGGQPTGITGGVPAPSGVAPTPPGTALPGATGGAALPPPQAPVQAGLSVGASRLRRLTRLEYDNTVRDLLGDATRPAAQFHPDEGVGVFASNTLTPVTQLQVERYRDAAAKIAASAVGRLDTLLGCNPAGAEEACVRSFVDRFARRAFRRPLESGEADALMAKYRDRRSRSDLAAGVRFVVESVLQSPFFLYRLEVGDPASENSGIRRLTDHEAASRLSYLLWASMPDDELFAAADRGALRTVDQLRAQATRMMADARGREAFRSFHEQWLGVADLEHNGTKDAALYGAFTPELARAMTEETRVFATEVLLKGDGKLATLLTAPFSFVDPSLRTLYGATASGRAGAFERVALPAGQRAGLLTQASFLAMWAKPDQSSPILRGKVVREHVLCGHVPEPPPDVEANPPKVDRNTTTRQRFAQHTTNPSCAACHRLMDPLGFAFESYDAIGRWRTMDGRFPVDTSGEIAGGTDVDGPFAGAVALATKLAASTTVRECYARNWLRFALGRIEGDDDAPSTKAVVDAFARSGTDVRELVLAVATSDAFRHVRLAR